jgi:SAM-dependent methyltransferase
VTSPAGADGSAGGVAQQYKRDFWIQENLKHVPAHYRLVKTARIVNKVAAGRECDLLDVGCGPATLSRLTEPGIHYYGIDIAIQQPAPNLVEADFLEAPIQFGGQRFDIVVAQGLFEYMADRQEQKFAEIAGLLRPDGSFVLTYTNFGHRRAQVFEAFSNVQPFADFRSSLGRYFTVERFFPTSHNPSGGQPARALLKAANMHLNVNVPILSPMFAVEYFLICSPR